MVEGHRQHQVRDLGPHPRQRRQPLEAARHRAPVVPGAGLAFPVPKSRLVSRCWQEIQTFGLLVLKVCRLGRGRVKLDLIPVKAPSMLRLAHHLEKGIAHTGVRGHSAPIKIQQPKLRTPLDP